MTAPVVTGTPSEPKRSDFSRVARTALVLLLLQLASGVADREAWAQQIVWLEPSVVEGASYPVWITLHGSGFTETTHIRIVSEQEHADTSIDDRRRLRLVSDSVMQVSIVVGAEAADWRIYARNAPSAPWSAPHPFGVLPPVPRINSMSVTTPDADGRRVVEVFSTTVTRYSHLLWRGDSIATTPLKTSTNPNAITTGLSGVIAGDGTASFWGGLDPGFIEIVTPGPGGGISSPFAAPIPWRPWTERWELWTILLSLFGLFGTAVAVLTNVRKQHDLRRMVADQTADLQASESQLRASTVELRQAEADRALLLECVAHEVRQPVTLAVGKIETAGLRMSEEDGDVMRLLDQARAELFRVADLTQQITDLARHRDVVQTFRPETFDLDALLARIVDTLQSWATSAELVLTYHCAGSVAAFADAEKLEAVVRNLVGNALKYAPAGERVAVSLDSSGGDIALRVEDTGGTLDPSHLNHLFEAHYRGVEDDHPTVGMGLGLHTVDVLVRLHSGTVDVGCTPGLSTRFTVHLPGAARDASDLAAVSAEVLVPSEQSGDPSWNTAASDAPLVLVVDDQASIRDLLRVQLGDLYRIVEAEDGAQAERIATESMPDLILTDLRMPIRDGSALIRALRTHSRTAAIPILVITADSADDVEVDILNTGALSVLGKPWRSAKLRAQVASLLDQRDRLRKRLIVPDGHDIPAEQEIFARQVEDAIEAGMGEKGFNVNSLVDALGTSRSQLGKSIKDVFGMTPKALLVKRRIERAHYLLGTGKRTRVGEVATEVGFTNDSRFRRAFKAQYGTLPNEVKGDSME